MVELECLSCGSDTAAKTPQHYLSTNQKAVRAGEEDMGVHVPYNKHTALQNTLTRKRVIFRKLCFKIHSWADLENVKITQMQKCTGGVQAWCGWKRNVNVDCSVCWQRFCCLLRSNLLWSEKCSISTKNVLTVSLIYLLLRKTVRAARTNHHIPQTVSVIVSFHPWALFNLAKIVHLHWCCKNLSG